VRGPGIFATALMLAACGETQAYDYPETARTAFAESCPTGDPRCDCMWDEITRTMPPEDYEAAMERFRTEGLMDPRLTRARLECREAK
jgi:hypothetical protein